MRRIDRYLLTQFVQVFLICYVSLTGLYVVIDAFGNLDDFISQAEQQGSLLEVVGRYYGYRSIALFDRMSGILALISAMFTVTWIQRHQEMTALLAAGIPTFRILAPVIAAAGSISLVASANRELVLPQMRQMLSMNAQDLAGSHGRDMQPRYDHQSEILLRGKLTYAAQQRVKDVDFLLPFQLSQHGKHLVAENAYYRPAQPGRPGGYLLVGVSKPSGLLTSPSLRLGEQTVVFTPHDTSWLKPNECFVKSDVSFDTLAGSNAFRLYSSTAELMRGLRNPSLDYGADVRVAVHGRLVQPFLDVTLLFLGLPLVVSRSNRNVFLAIGLCILLALGFMVVIFACQAMGSNYWVDPALSAWLPLMLFVPIAVGMSDPLRQ